MEQTFTWKDPYSIRTVTIHYIVDKDNCRVIDSFKYVDNDKIKIAFIKHIMDTNSNFLTGKRSVQSYVTEWKAHNILYRWGILKGSTKDSDLQIKESKLRRIGYHILVKCFQESDRKKRYNKIMKEYKKKLTKLNKDVSRIPWSGNMGIEYYVEYLRFMRDYYENGYNVHAYDFCECEEFFPEHKDRPTRLQSLNMALAAYDDWQNCEEKYYQWVPDDPNDPYKWTTEKNEDGTYTVKDLGGHIQYLIADPTENNRAFRKEYESLKKRFFEIIAEYHDDWWD